MPIQVSEKTTIENKLAYADDIDIVGRSQSTVWDAYLAMERRQTTNCSYMRERFSERYAAQTSKIESQEKVQPRSR
jgi:uncharacterized protein with PIN domain